MSVARAASEFKQALAERQAHPQSVWGLPTGVPDLDDKTGGLHPGELTIVGGRTSMGKTAVLTTAVRTACEHLRATRDPKVVGFISAEMSGEQLIRRFVSQGRLIRAHDLMTGELDEGDVNAANAYADEVARWPLLIDDSVSPTIKQTHQTLSRWAEEAPYAMIVVDHIGKLVATDAYGKVIDRDYTAQTLAANALFKWAREFKCPVLAAAQLSRKLEDRENRRPMLSDLRDSGRIEENADVVWLLFRPKYYEALERGQDIATGDELEITVAKGRNVGVGTARVDFLPEYTRLEPRMQPVRNPGARAHA